MTFFEHLAVQAIIAPWLIGIAVLARAIAL